MATRIINLNNKEAFDFLMKPEQYCTTELPEYFEFSPVLDYCKKELRGKKFVSIPESIHDVNLDILTNKDGKYGVRPITISNPFLYTYLARTICDKDAWSKIVECFKVFDVENVTACAIPVVPDAETKEPFHKSTTILNWWSSMEQTPIELSMKYRYMFMSDITNCFGQIIPKSIDWALSRKGTDVSTDDNHELAGEIIRITEALQNGRNVGLPQGSTIYSLIAELVLGYSDLLLAGEIKKAGITVEYQILRYVDDYRIFCNDRNALEQISYLLQHVLESLNFRMNVSKTKISETIVADAVKPDKAFYIFNTPVFSKKGVDFDGFQKHLYFIFEFGRKFPNSGQMKVLLSDFSKRLEKYLKPRESKNSRVIAEIDLEKGVTTECDNPATYKPVIREKILPMIATLSQIALDNVSVAHYALRVISILLNTVKDIEEKNVIIGMVYRKLRNSPNSAYTQLWLQTLTHATGIKEINDYDVPLCNVVKTPIAPLWNIEWVDQKITASFPAYQVFNRKKLEKTGQIITFREHRAYTESPAYEG